MSCELDLLPTALRFLACIILYQPTASFEFQYHLHVEKVSYDTTAELSDTYPARRKPSISYEATRVNEKARQSEIDRIMIQARVVSSVE